MDILSIGNSFSQDAQRYVHGIAKSDGFNLNAFNLYIGGCPLSSHFRNMLKDERAYLLEMNGERTGFYVSIKEALLNRDWDVITVQQASHFSNDYNTYQPYLNKLVEFIKECVPKAKIVVHQTWAYAKGSNRLTTLMGYEEHTDMFRDIKAAYEKATKDISADMLIPCGELLQNLIAAGIESVHRDDFHTSLGLGRYAMGLLWYSMLTENDIKNNTFCDFDEEITEEQIAIAKGCVEKTIKQYK